MCWKMCVIWKCIKFIRVSIDVVGNGFTLVQLMAWCLLNSNQIIINLAHSRLMLDRKRIIAEIWIYCFLALMSFVLCSEVVPTWEVMGVFGRIYWSGLVLQRQWDIYLKLLSEEPLSAVSLTELRCKISHALESVRLELNIYSKLDLIAKSNPLKINLMGNYVLFLAATKQLYDWFSPSVRLSVRPSVCPSVTPISPCSHHRIIMKFSGVIAMVRSDVHAKGQGQRSKVKVTEVITQLSRFRTLIPVRIHIWQWNHAHSWKQHRRGALLFFKVIHQI